ncbi:phosphomevalonate kinase [Sporosarcina ureilytica]|uniref:phosphomevalonate kinase n=1 Tax=Sporosarcina ureilytica TaxID=298596 RepID=A0A1D8JDC0_9BACL|nr:phosphomevalonate kinase [Sporosarcina ureilytica]AOV06702.1 phosphomevalonate kinase [Sporosarcina ureilytica]
MTVSSYRIKAPGKMMIAGEYAVLEPRQLAVVGAITRYVTVKIEEGTKNALSIPAFGLKEITWGDEPECLLSTKDPRLRFIQNALVVATRFLREKNVPIQKCSITTLSELDDKNSGVKYGLGSSAAITVAVVTAMIKFHLSDEDDVSQDTIFKLAVIAHFLTQQNGSGADIAAAVYGGLLAYCTFNGDWLTEKLENDEPFATLVEQHWPDLMIERLNPSEAFSMSVGWTKKSAATGPMVNKVQAFQLESPLMYARFLEESHAAVTRFIQGIKTNHQQDVLAAIRENRLLLKRLGEDAGVPIETAELTNLCQIAEKFGSGKPSGAGGGDCGIAFLNDPEQKHNLIEAWQAAGIEPLDLEISNSGVTFIEYDCKPTLDQYLQIQHQQ